MTHACSPTPIKSIVSDLSAGEVAAELRVHDNTLKRLLATGSFPNAYRLNRRWRIPRADLDAFKASRRIGGAK